MHPSFMTRHSKARMTCRVRRYITAQVSWVRQMIAERKDIDERDSEWTFFFLGGGSRKKRDWGEKQSYDCRRELPVKESNLM